MILKFPSFQPTCVIAISDASFANMQGGRSQSGHFLLLCDARIDRGETGQFSVIQWRSGRQRRVARSTFGAETLALADAVDGGDFLRGAFHELLTGGDPREGLRSGLNMHWCTDSHDLFDSLHKDGTVSTAERRLALDVLVLKELLERDRDQLHWVSTLQMLADPLTKSMPADYLLSRLRDCTWSFASDPALQKVKKLKAPLPLPKLAALASKPMHSRKKERAV